MVELMVTLAIAGLLMAAATLGMRTYLKATRESGTATDIRSALRNASERSIADGVTYCVKFTSTTWTTYIHDCTVAADAVDGPTKVEESSVTLSASFSVVSEPGYVSACPAGAGCAYFYPRGIATGGTVTVSRPGKTYTVKVEGLTGRVSSG
jgi:Tfp pilus assembly protein FimT